LAQGLAQARASVKLCASFRTLLSSSNSDSEAMQNCFMVASAIVGLSAATSSPTVLVTGATGATGIQIYQQLQAAGSFKVRAFVRDAAKAKGKLGCDKCDESEGVFVGDLGNATSVQHAMQGVDMLAIAAAAVLDCNGPRDPTKPPCYFHNGSYPIDIDWKATKTQVAALAASGDISTKQVALVSSRDTYNPESRYGNLGNGHQAFYKLNAEAFILQSGVPFTIVKACGLGDDKPGQYKLVVGHDGEGYDQQKDNVIVRSDVARVIVSAFKNPSSSRNLRFDLC